MWSATAGERGFSGTDEEGPAVSDHTTTTNDVDETAVLHTVESTSWSSLVHNTASSTSDASEKQERGNYNGPWRKGRQNAQVGNRESGTRAPQADICHTEPSRSHRLVED